MSIYFATARTPNVTAVGRGSHDVEAGGALSCFSAQPFPQVGRMLLAKRIKRIPNSAPLSQSLCSCNALRRLNARWRVATQGLCRHVPQPAYARILGHEARSSKILLQAQLASTCALCCTPGRALFFLWICCLTAETFCFLDQKAGSSWPQVASHFMISSTTLCGTRRRRANARSSSSTLTLASTSFFHSAVPMGVLFC